MGNHKYITYVNLEQLQELVAFCQKKHVCGGGESQIHSWYQLEGCEAGFVSSRSLRLVGPHGSFRPPDHPQSNPR